MSVFGKGVSILGKLAVFVSLLAVFAAGLIGVFYIQLKGEEVEIPKVIGLDFNDGKDELAVKGLRIKKIAKRFSNEDPNTIIEQRPRPGSTAKTGLTISVIVSEKSPDGYEDPVKIKDDDEAIEEIEDQPELKIEKPKKKAAPKKKKKKTRDVVDTKPDEAAKDGESMELPKAKDPAKVVTQPSPNKPAEKPKATPKKKAEPKKAQPQKPKPTPPQRKKRVVGNN